MNLLSGTTARANSNSARAHLKRITDPAHSALHDHPVAVAIIQDGSVEALRVMLAANLSLLIQLETGAPEPLKCCIANLKDALQHDLAQDTCGSSASTNYEFDRATLAGFGYVALGSMMGSKTLRKAMQQNANAPFPDRYLTSSMPMAWWHWTLAELEELATIKTQWVKVETAAIMAFQHIRAALDAGTNQRLRDG